ncbi:MAG: hypothetical protein JWN98_1451 [Abditibacteriota bacterium]|nr:hypothetical protein [Abditibacteriota bacterium]
MGLFIFTPKFFIRALLLGAKRSRKLLVVPAQEIGSRNCFDVAISEKNDVATAMARQIGQRSAFVGRIELIGKQRHGGAVAKFAR